MRDNSSLVVLTYMRIWPLMMVILDSKLSLSSFIGLLSKCIHLFHTSQPVHFCH
jgi:hypothetical protein